MGYEGILMKAAQEKYTLIQRANLVDNIHELNDLIARKKYAKQLVKVKEDSPVLKIEFAKLKEFILNHPALKRRIKFNKSQDKIKFHSNKSKELFIKLLGDDYLIDR